MPQGTAALPYPRIDIRNDAAYLSEVPELTPLEKAVFDLLLAGEDEILAILRVQLEASTIKSREFSGTGFFTNFDVPKDAPLLPGKIAPFGDIFADIEGLEYGSIFVLFTNDGRLDFLEGASFQENWPETTDKFVARYEPGPDRDWAKLRQHWQGINQVSQLSVEQIEGVIWSPPITSDPLSLTFHEARKKPVCSLSPAETLLLFDQGYCKEQLLRRALQLLEQSHVFYDDELLDRVLPYFIHKRKPTQEEIQQVLKILEPIPPPSDELDEYTLSHTQIGVFKDMYGKTA